MLIIESVWSRSLLDYVNGVRRSEYRGMLGRVVKCTKSDQYNFELLYFVKNFKNQIKSPDLDDFWVKIILNKQRDCVVSACMIF